MIRSRKRDFKIRPRKKAKYLRIFDFEKAPTHDDARNSSATSFVGLLLSAFFVL